MSAQMLSCHLHPHLALPAQVLGAGLQVKRRLETLFCQLTNAALHHEKTVAPEFRGGATRQKILHRIFFPQTQSQSTILSRLFFMQVFMTILQNT